MRTIETIVYHYAELSDTAKEQARDWYRAFAADSFADFASGSVLEDAARLARMFGLNISTKPVKLMNGSTRYDPNVFWAVASRDSGASFAGHYSYQKGSVSAVTTEAPQDLELHRIVRALADVQRRNFYRIAASVEHGRQSWTLRIDVERTDDVNLSTDDETEVKDALTDFANWIQAGLETEFEYQTSDEQVSETIIANEYEFTEDGDRACCLQPSKSM